MIQIKIGSNSVYSKYLFCVLYSVHRNRDSWSTGLLLVFRLLCFKRRLREISFASFRLNYTTAHLLILKNKISFSLFKDWGSWRSPVIQLLVGQV